MSTRSKRAAKQEADVARMIKSVKKVLEPSSKDGDDKSRALEILKQYEQSKDRQSVQKARAGGGFDTPMYPDEELRSLLQLPPGEPIRRIDLTIALNVYWDYRKINVDPQHEKWAHLNTCERSLKDPKDRRFINVVADPVLARLLQYDLFVKQIENGDKRKIVSEQMFKDKFAKSLKENELGSIVKRNAKWCRVERLETVDVAGKPVASYAIIETDPRIMLCTVQQLISTHLSKTPPEPVDPRLTLTVDSESQRPADNLRSKCEGKCKTAAFEPFLKK